MWFSDSPGPALSALRALLLPLSWLAGRIAERRRARIRALRPPPRPVVVVGNLVTGGAGKTPLAIAIATGLAARGLRCGILASGYRAARSEARLVDARSDPALDGDEPVLLAAATGLPVAAGRRRADALELLRASHPELEVIVSDDGLQHESLARTLEIAVFDARGAGNGRLLPAGPLREPLAHCSDMDAIALNGPAQAPLAHPRSFRFEVRPTRFVHVAGREPPCEPGAFARVLRGRALLAIAGIGEPERFFRTLRGLGLDPQCVALGDHARIDAQWLGSLQAPVIVMTAKDAVKCRAFADDRCWALEVGALADPALIDWIAEATRGRPIA